jgi:hypothetical protein
LELECENATRLLWLRRTAAGSDLMTNDPFHYPPELLSLLIDTIPRLCRSKQDVLLFLQGCGVAESLMADCERSRRVQMADREKCTASLRA